MRFEPLQVSKMLLAVLLASMLGCQSQLLDLNPHVSRLKEPSFSGTLESVELRRTASQFGPGITVDSWTATWRETTETAIRDAGVFSERGQTTYRLVIEPLDFTSSGLITTVAHIRATYKVLDSKTGRPVWAFNSDSSASASDFSGGVRFQKAFGSALRQNIAQVIDAIDKVAK